MAEGAERVLLSAGEASGDRIAGAVAHELARRGVSAFGMGGASSQAAGVRLVCDLQQVTAMGAVEAAQRLPELARAYVRLIQETRRRRPAAAVLVSFTEFHVLLGRALKAAGVRVLWCVAPQVWAWRRSRLQTLRRSLDKLCVILPFEEPIWRAQNYDVRYVGHPASEQRLLSRAEARAKLGLTERAQCVALLPGSRPQEVDHLLLPLLRAFALLRSERGAVDARVLMAPSLGEDRRRLMLRSCEAYGLGAVDIDPLEGIAPLLPAFDAAIACSGTATLECALAGAPPVIVYRTGSLTHLLGRALVRVPHIGLPNLLLKRRAFPEILQGDASPARIAQDLSRILDDPEIYQQDAEQLRETLRSVEPGAGQSSHSLGGRIVDALWPWLA